VLLVEEDERLARITAQYLQRNGIHVTIARDGQRALAQARGQPFDLLLIVKLASPGEVDRVLGLELRSGSAERVLRAGRLTLDLGALTVSLDGKSIALTGYEFALLRAFAERPGLVLSREQLLDIAKGSAEEAFDRSIDGHISRLRRKLGDDPRRPSLLKTVRGAGYVLAVG
jgi:two-component system OmpR family response regulator